MKMSPFWVKLPASRLEIIKKLAKAEGRSAPNLVASIVEDWLWRNYPELVKEKALNSFDAQSISE